ncbi:hypothetical protein SE17_34905 [Kouleothrix aurantiaca]|uniref:Uncharacterized protein n=1 Tax=Kouleothrix aurantiaca TaxID=186479 RepID=A0A0P9CTR7_9CHLR|nr:hypothetical protein SE17_34905 [Kouleothrix aurantiaca]
MNDALDTELGNPCRYTDGNGTVCPAFIGSVNPDGSCHIVAWTVYTDGSGAFNQVWLNVSRADDTGTLNTWTRNI